VLYRSAIRWRLLLKPKLAVGRLAVSTGIGMAITPSAEQPKLASGALKLGAVFFHTLAHMAPVGAVVYSVQYPAVQAGPSLALAYVLAVLACLLTALCLKELVRKVRSAGGYFTMHSVALGHLAGFTTSWLWFIYAGP
jgi:amino acid transporter